MNWRQRSVEVPDGPTSWGSVLKQEFGTVEKVGVGGGGGGAPKVNPEMFETPPAAPSSGVGTWGCDSSENNGFGIRGTPHVSFQVVMGPTSASAHIRTKSSHPQQNGCGCLQILN